jgi:nicotinate-nucleotide adenylyltransferase
MKIGLLGGSFNPPHEGHVNLCVQAKKYLGLDAIWWLVSPANPFKDARTLAPFELRYQLACELPKPPYIQVTDYEQRGQLLYTIDSIKSLQHDFHGIKFVWLMGADNLPNFHLWNGAQEIMARVPVAVMDRSPNSHNALRSKTAIKYANNKVDGRLLMQATPPCWSYVFMRRNNQSATEIRKKLGSQAFLTI